MLPPVVLAALLALSAPPWPDDWDGFGFLQSIERFDMDRFAPHPPGYPVYVVLLRLAALVFRDPMHAAIAVSVASGVAVFVAARSAAARVGEVAALAIAVAVVASPLAWRAFTGVGSEAPALALVAGACWAIQRARRGSRVHGDAAAVAIGLALGVRLSWAPLLLGLLVLVPAKGRALAMTALAVTVWLVPLLAVVGPRHLVAVYGSHLSGHAARWGGTALTERRPLVRLALVARDLLVDGVGADSDVLGVALGLLFGALTVAVTRRGGFSNMRAVLLCLPYALWMLVGQNLREQPRHALPLVAVALSAVGAGAARAKLGALALPVLLLMLARTGLDAYDRRTIPPAGAQLVVFMQDRPDDVVFGGASIRYFWRTAVGGRAILAETRGDVDVATTRMDRLPAHRLVTSEIRDVDDAPIIATFCRPPRLDRKRPCLDVRALE